MAWQQWKKKKKAKGMGREKARLWHDDVGVRISRVKKSMRME
jgi:hypothetical protein